MRWRKRCAAAALPLLAAATVVGPIDLVRPWALPADQGADTGLFMQIDNAGPTPDRFVRAVCAGSVAATLIQGSTAPPVLDIPAHQSLILAPNGVHLVVHGLAGAAQPGMRLHCAATFARAGERLFEATVRTAPPAVPPD